MQLLVTVRFQISISSNSVLTECAFQILAVMWKLDGFGKEEDKDRRYMMGDKYAQLKTKI